MNRFADEGGITARTTESVNTWGSLLQSCAHVRELGLRAAGDDAQLAPDVRRVESPDGGDRRDTATDARLAARRHVGSVIVWMIVIVLVFAPLAIARCRRCV